MQRMLVLEDGSVFPGIALGYDCEVTGEVVFHTGITGYQEILSDPSYCRQIVTLTYPLIGNYGINRDDFQSLRPSIGGLVVREACEVPSNWRSRETVDQFLQRNQIPGLQGVDTRRLTRLIRKQGTLRGRLCHIGDNAKQVAEDLKTTDLVRNQVAQVSTAKPFFCPNRGHRIVLVDFGCKSGIIRDLLMYQCEVVVVPYHATSDDILHYQPDGVILSNGPGNPIDVPEAVPTIQDLLGQVPLFGICLGHQLFALACGATTSRLKFGHRGANHPVKDLGSGEVEITSQNHGYTVDTASLSGTRLLVTHRNINDQTVEGLRHQDVLAYSVQFHPEASPGPQNPRSLLYQFISDIQGGEMIHG